jgi:hypothetical protein
LRLAWIHIKKYGVDRAIENICNQLVMFTKSIGAIDKYNKTLTVAAIKAVNHFIMQSNSKTFQEFVLEFPRLKYDFKALMDAHYLIDIYNSEKAKSEYIEPDLLPFD